MMKIVNTINNIIYLKVNVHTNHSCTRTAFVFKSFEDIIDNDNCCGHAVRHMLQTL